MASQQQFEPAPSPPLLAYFDGMDARRMGMPRCANPHLGEEAQEWDRGWNYRWEVST